MNTKNLVFGVVTIAALSGCLSQTPSNEPELRSFDKGKVASEVESTVRSFFSGFALATCEDGRSVSKYARDPVIYVGDDFIYEVSLADFEQGVRERACKWKSHGGTVDSVVVEAFTQNIASAAWTYTDDIILLDGSRRQTKGAVLMNFIRTPDGWKITSSKTTENLISSE